VSERKIIMFVDFNDVIARLADEYPQTFFRIPQLRRPIKRDILADLWNDGFECEREMLMAALQWYQGHTAYLHQLKAGTPRLDLHGKGGDKVTPAEEVEAQTEIARIRERRAVNNAANSVRSSMSGLPDDIVRKVEVPRRQPPPLNEPQPYVDGSNACGANGNGSANGVDVAKHSPRSDEDLLAGATKKLTRARALRRDGHEDGLLSALLRPLLRSAIDDLSILHARVTK
jgi:sRNA-binding protein